MALLAGVGVTWYTWLEQGREINASVQVLEAIARTLKMDNQERWHLFELAGVTIAAPASSCAAVSTEGREILDQLDPFPAVVVSERYDILAYNRAYNRLGGDLDSMEPGERNHLWLFFTHPYWQDLCVADKRPEAAAHLVGTMRAAMARHLDDPLWTQLVQRLREASAEFEALWRRHDVVDNAQPAKDFTSPVGELRVTATRFAAGRDGLTRMLVYTARDDETRARLDRLVAYDAAQRLMAV